MDRFKNVAKGGWHPEKNATSNSGGGPSDSKLGQVKGWVGRAQGKDIHAESAREHQSAPLATLKDPSSFAPPPKRVAYGASSSAAPPVPASRPKPSLPPRLPPRQNSNPDAHAPPPPPAYHEATQQGTPSQGVLNQGALNRLGQAGVSIPGFGIGRTASPPVPPRKKTEPPAAAGQGPQMNELQNQFANMSTPTAQPAHSTPGTSWAEKQAALRTASTLRDDPAKVNAADLRSAAATANSFHQRHGEQVAGGWKAASGLNAKYGIAGKVNSLASSSAAPAAQSTPGVPGKKPPPPPPKKRELAAGASEPPPIPLSSKPKF